MKDILLTIMIGLGVLTPIAISQTPDATATPTKTEKEDAKKAEKDAKKERGARLKAMQIPLNQLSSFPQTFVGTTKRAKPVMLGEIKPYTDSGITGYFIAVRQDEAQFWNFPNPDTVAFVADEGMARQIFAYYEENKNMWRDWYPASIVFETYKGEAGGRTYYMSKINCVEFLGTFSRVWKSIGQCD
jgi:hypothetical protein